MNRILKSLAHKAKRSYDYTKALSLFYITKPLACIMKKCCPEYKGLWLVAERGNDARDNGYWFFRYLRGEKPNENAVYVISKNDTDYPKIAPLGKTVKSGSYKHYLLYNCAKYLVGTHVQPSAPDNMIFYRLASRGIMAKGRQVFLQHGVIKDNMEWLHCPKLCIDLFVCGAKMEHDYIEEVYNHPRGVAQYLGLCRFDHLMTAGKPKHRILVMPTWRGYYYPRGKEFLNTDFYKYFQAFLSDPRLIALLERTEHELIFYPHIELQSELNSFVSKSSRIVLADSKHYDVQQLIMDCDVMITDFSSVYFDAGFLRKPVIYYQFDEAEFHKIHYSQGYFIYDEHGFGPVCRDEDALMHELEKLASRDFEIDEKYLKRETEFFPLYDAKNCERTYNAITALDGRVKR